MASRPDRCIGGSADHDDPYPIILEFAEGLNQLFNKSSTEGIVLGRLIQCHCPNLIGRLAKDKHGRVLGVFLVLAVQECKNFVSVTIQFRWRLVFHTFGYTRELDGITGNLQIADNWICNRNDHVACCHLRVFHDLCDGVDRSARHTCSIEGLDPLLRGPISQCTLYVCLQNINVGMAERISLVV